MTGPAPSPRRGGRGSSSRAAVGIGEIVAAIAILFSLVFGGLMLPVAARDEATLVEALWVLIALGIGPAVSSGVLIFCGWRPGTVAIRAGWFMVGLYFIARPIIGGEDSRVTIVARRVGRSRSRRSADSVQSRPRHPLSPSAPARHRLSTARPAVHRQGATALMT